MQEENQGTRMKQHFSEEAIQLFDQLVEWRRGFHVFPELAFEERVTSSRIIQILESTPGVEVTRGFGDTTSVVGKIRGKIDDNAVMLRSAMDALSLQEETDLPFASCIPGVMHGCGHDAHMAALLGAVKLLSNHRDMLVRPIVFVFQPAEEGLGGGARRLVEAGLLDTYKIKHALGFHFWPKYGYGKLLLRHGVMTALSDRFHVSVQGVGGHVAAPHLAVDPWTIVAHLIFAVQGLIGREIDPTESAVISFGRLEAGDAYNVIPGQVDMWGSLRALNPEVRDFLQSRLEDIVPLLARTFRGLGTIKYHRNYPQVVNDKDLTDIVLSIAFEYMDKDNVEILEKPLMSGEDFAFYAQIVPSCFMLFGTGSKYWLHHPKYDVPEELLSLASGWEAYLAFRLSTMGIAEEGQIG